jgi:hypothetical protein
MTTTDEKGDSRKPVHCHGQSLADRWNKGRSPDLSTFWPELSGGLPDNAPPHRHATETANIDIRVGPWLVEKIDLAFPA